MAWYMAALPAVTPIMRNSSRRVGEGKTVCFTIRYLKGSVWNGYHMKPRGVQGGERQSRRGRQVQCKRQCRAH